MEYYYGQLIMFAGNFAPRNFAFCNGQLLPISSNEALFSIIGTTYGGDGRTTFALPDLRGRVPLHYGLGNGLHAKQLGEKNGTETNTLTILNLPTHTHSITIDVPISGDDGTSDEAGGLLATTDGTKLYANTASGNYTGGPINIQTTQTGANQSVNNMAPY